MIHFLRDRDNRTIIETEIWNRKDDNGGDYTEISSSVNILHYSLFLLQAHNAAKADIISIISDLDELRGWLWEVYFMDEKNDGTKKDDIEKKVGGFFNDSSKKLGLNYVTD